MAAERMIGLVRAPPKARRQTVDERNVADEVVEVEAHSAAIVEASEPGLDRFERFFHQVMCGEEGVGGGALDEEIERQALVDLGADFVAEIAARRGNGCAVTLPILGHGSLRFRLRLGPAGGPVGIEWIEVRFALGRSGRGFGPRLGLLRRGFGGGETEVIVIHGILLTAELAAQLYQSGAVSLVVLDPPYHPS